MILSIHKFDHLKADDPMFYAVVEAYLRLELSKVVTRFADKTKRCEKCNQWFLALSERGISRKYCSGACAHNMAAVQYNRRKQKEVE